MSQVRWWFTDRAGGTGARPWDTANLATHVGDDPRVVAANRSRLADDLGSAADHLVWMDQVHGTEVAVVDAPGLSVPTADALVTTTPGLALCVLVADCVPVLLHDADRRVAAAVHAGRRGVANGIVAATVAVMRGEGAERLSAQVGPAICPGCYEVGDDVQAEVAAAVPQATARSRGGRAALDLRAGVLAQLAEAGVTEVGVDLRCTAEDPRLFSHRRDGVCGRQAGVIVLAP